MSTPLTTTPLSGKTTYFDAMATPDVPPTSADAASSPIAPAGPSNAADDVEAEAPEYSPGPDEKLSREYGTDTKVAVADAAETTTQATESVFSGGNGSKRDNEGSTFANGAAITGAHTHSPEEQALHDRSATAETNLSAKTKSKISKAELKDGKRISKIIKAESKAEQQALNAAIKELAELQSQQSGATKREAKAHTAHTKALALHHKTETKYLALKAVYERNQLDAQNMEAALEVERANAREVTERTAEKATEVEKLRLQHAADEREREQKLLELNQGKTGGGFLCF